MANPDASRRKRRGLRIALIAIAVLVVLLVVGGGAFLASFDPNSLKPRIEAAVKQATGRDLTLNGPIRLQWALRPTLAVNDVALSNPPGFSRPEMAKLQRLELRLALFPLLHRQVEIDRLALIKPDIALETDAQGRPNWQFTPAPAQGASQSTPETRPLENQQGGGTRIAIRSLSIEDGQLSYRDGRTGKTTVLGISDLQVDAPELGGPMHLTMAASYNGTPFKAAGDLGPLSRLQEPAGSSEKPWPVNVTVSAVGSQLTIDGGLTDPMHGKGYDLSVNGTVPDAAALAPFAQGISLPPVHDLRFAAQIADRGGPVPEISGLQVHAGASDLSAYAAGLKLTKLDVSAPKLDQPVKLAAEGALGAAPVSVSGTLGPLGRFLPGAAGTTPYPVDISGKAAGASFSVKGGIADPVRLAGANLAVQAQIPDLAALSPFAHQNLPAIKDVAFSSQLTDAQGGFAKGAALRQMKLTAPQFDVEGDLAATLGKPPSVTANLRAGHIDADAVLAAAGKPVTGPTGKAPTGQPPPQAAAPPAAKSGRLFPDTPIPFGALKLVNADVLLAVAELKTGGQTYRDLNTHVVVRDGSLRADPFAANLPGGHLDAKLTVEGTRPGPPVSLHLHAPGLAMAPLLAALNEPQVLSGNLEVYADLRAAGGTPHALASTLDGSLGLAMANGQIDNKLLGSMLGKVLEKANALDLVGRGGVSDLRCFAARIDARNGIGTFRTLELSSSLITVSGGGTVNLGQETISLQLRPEGRVGGNQFVIPVRVTGPILSPSVSLDAAAAAEANAGAAAGAALGKEIPLGLLGGVLGGGKVPGLGPVAGGGQSCETALALARGQPAPAPPPPEAKPQRAAPASPQPKVPDLGGALRQLLR
jgi:AsmA protein